MLKKLFGSLSRERVLTFIAARDEGYALEIVKFWNCPDRPIKRELNQLEAQGVLICKNYGKTVIYKMNPKYFLRKELKALLMKNIDSYPPEWKEALLYNRRRPRAKGKEVLLIKDIKNANK